MHEISCFYSRRNIVNNKIFIYNRYRYNVCSIFGLIHRSMLKFALRLLLGFQFIAFWQMPVSSSYNRLKLFFQTISIYVNRNVIFKHILTESSPKLSDCSCGISEIWIFLNCCYYDIGCMDSFEVLARCSCVWTQVMFYIVATRPVIYPS